MHWSREPVTEFGLAFMAGLAGSGHCLGMCGGIATALAVANPAASAAQRFRMNAAYHVGRIITYTLLGILAGATSQMVLVTSLKPYLYGLFMAANISVIVIGVATALGLQRFSLSLFDGTGWGFMSSILRWSSVQASSVAFLSAGLVMGLIPCGMVYGVLIMAATGGLWLHGAGMMLFFGIGTLPALLAYGQFATSLSAMAGHVFTRCMGVAVALLGLIGLMNSLSNMGLISLLKLW